MDWIPKSDPKDGEFFAVDKSDANVGEFFVQQNAEIDALYQQWADKLMAESLAMPPLSPLTRRQRLTVAIYRARYWLALPLVKLANWISPGIASEECDCS